MIDANEHVLTGTLAEKIAEMGIAEAITGKRHEDKGFQPTHQAGSKLIDGIFLSSSIIMQVEGRIPFGLAQYDHRAI